VWNGNIWISDNSGVTWTEDTSVGVSKNWQCITSSADGTNLAAGTSNNNIWISVNSGVTWTEVTSTGAVKDWTGITISADGTKLAAVSTVTGATSGNIWISDNSGATWSEKTFGFHRWTSITSDASGEKLAASEYNAFDNTGRIWTSSNYGETWMAYYLIVPEHKPLNFTTTPYNTLGVSGDITDVSYIKLSWDPPVNDIYDIPGFPIPESYGITRRTANYSYNYIIDYSNNSISGTDISFNDTNFPLANNPTWPRTYRYDLSANYI
jgi:hypothetical protein